MSQLSHHKEQQRAESNVSGLPESNVLVERSSGSQERRGVPEMDLGVPGVLDRGLRVPEEAA
jgi:hypothetical protein